MSSWLTPKSKAPKDARFAKNGFSQKGCFKSWFPRMSFATKVKLCIRHASLCRCRCSVVQNQFTHCRCLNVQKTRSQRKLQSQLQRGDAWVVTTPSESTVIPRCPLKIAMWCFNVAHLHYTCIYIYTCIDLCCITFYRVGDRLLPHGPS